MLVEMLSQSYRCILPITPWIYFLVDDDDGEWISFAKALLVVYVCFKVTTAPHGAQHPTGHSTPRDTASHGTQHPQGTVPHGELNPTGLPP